MSTHLVNSQQRRWNRAFDRSRPVPMYHQLKEWLSGRILSGELAPGEQLPGELELCERLHVSRGRRPPGPERAPLRRASSSGSAARARSSPMPKTAEGLISGLRGLAEDAALRGQRIESTVLVLRERPADAVVARSLGLEPGEPVVELERLRSLDGEPHVLVTTYLPARAGARARRRATSAGPHRSTASCARSTGCAIVSSVAARRGRRRRRPRRRTCSRIDRGDPAARPALDGVHDRPPSARVLRRLPPRRPQRLRGGARRRLRPGDALRPRHRGSGRRERAPRRRRRRHAEREGGALRAAAARASPSARLPLALAPPRRRRGRAGAGRLRRAAADADRRAASSAPAALRARSPASRSPVRWRAIARDRRRRPAPSPRTTRWLDSRCRAEVAEIAERLGDEVVERDRLPADGRARAEDPLVEAAPSRRLRARRASGSSRARYVAGRLCGLDRGRRVRRLDVPALQRPRRGGDRGRGRRSSPASSASTSTRLPRIVAPTELVGGLDAASARAACGLRPGHARRGRARRHRRRRARRRARRARAGARHRRHRLRARRLDRRLPARRRDADARLDARRGPGPVDRALVPRRRQPAALAAAGARGTGRRRRRSLETLLAEAAASAPARAGGRSSSRTSAAGSCPRRPARAAPGSGSTSRTTAATSSAPCSRASPSSTRGLPRARAASSIPELAPRRGARDRRRRRRPRSGTGSRPPCSGFRTCGSTRESFGCWGAALVAGAAVGARRRSRRRRARGDRGRRERVEPDPAARTRLYAERLPEYRSRRRCAARTSPRGGGTHDAASASPSSAPGARGMVHAINARRWLVGRRARLRRRRRPRRGRASVGRRARRARVREPRGRARRERARRRRDHDADLHARRARRARRRRRARTSSARSRWR